MNCVFCNNEGKKMIEGKNEIGEKVYAHKLCLDVNQRMIPSRTQYATAKEKSDMIDSKITQMLSGFKM